MINVYKMYHFRIRISYRATVHDLCDSQCIEINYMLKYQRNIKVLVVRSIRCRCKICIYCFLIQKKNLIMITLILVVS
jgi:hypothetical protein